MGWKSTVSISREAAIAGILKAVHHASDDDLFYALEILLGDKYGYNFRRGFDDEVDKNFLESLDWRLKDE